MKLYQSVFLFCFIVSGVFATVPEVTVISHTVLRENPPDQEAALWPLFNGSLFRSGDILVLPEIMYPAANGYSNKISALDLTQKKIVWTIFLGSPVSACKQTGNLVAVSSENQVTAIDIATGKIRWQYDGDKIIYDSFKVGSSQIYSQNLNNRAQMGLCVNSDNAICILDYGKSKIDIVDTQGIITATVNLPAEMASMFAKPFFIKFHCFNDGYIAAGTGRIVSLSADGTIRDTFRYDADVCTILISDLDASSPGDELVLGYKDELLILDRNLKLLHKNKMPKVVDKLQAIERIGNTILAYDSSTVYTCGLDGSLMWFYRAEGKSGSFLTFTLSPLLLSHALCIASRPDVFMVELANRIVFLNRETGVKLGEYKYDPEIKSSDLIDTLRLSTFPMQAYGDDGIILFEHSLKKFTDPGTFGAKHFSITEYLYEIRIR